MSPAVERVFLGWDAPALPGAVRRLLDRASDAADGVFDLSDLVVVVPTGRVRRMLIGALVDEAEARGGAVAPPEVITPGLLPDALVGPVGAHAPPLRRRLAWIDALRSLDEAAREAALRLTPGDEDLGEWSRLARMLEDASDELAASNLLFADVAERAGSWLPEEEAARWRALGVVQREAEARLRARGLVDQRLAARACVNAAAPACDGGSAREVVLLGVAEIRAIDRLAMERAGARVTSLVFAPEHLAERFDDLGCVRVESWLEATVDLEASRIVFAEDPEDEAERALVHLAGGADPVDVGEVVIGAADPDLIPRLRRRAEIASGVHVRSAEGDPCSLAPPGRLLTLLREHLRRPTLDTLLALARHPDVEHALLRMAPGREEGAGERRMEWWLEPLDRLRREHVLIDFSEAPAKSRAHEKEALRFVRDGVAALLSPLVAEEEGARPVREWAAPIGAALRGIYTERTLEADRRDDRRTAHALEAIRDALGELGGADTEPPLSCAAWRAIGLIEQRLADVSTPEPPRRDALETIGWLELALDPSPACVVVGMTDQRVPGAITHDALLPNSLRERLGLPTNDSRLARDVFLLEAINRSREAVFSVARRSAEGDPQTPSRVLFRCGGRALAQRVRRFTDPDVDGAEGVRLSSGSTPGDRDLFLPEVRISEDYAPPTEMRVTDFGAYLRSPVGWYLERFLSLKERDEPPREMDARLRGTIIHETLERFGRDESIRDADDPEQIAQALKSMLEAALGERFGSRRPASVLVQQDLIEWRLSLFAHAQAARRRKGWRIERVEWTPGANGQAPTLDVDGTPVGLRARIDRIDAHEDGSRAVIDYKTGRLGSGAWANSSHRRRDGTWTSLQLPLYRHLVRPLGFSGELRLGYAGLPSKESEIGKAWSFAGWDEEALEDADEAARRVVRALRSYRPGDLLEGGESPPDEAVLGFLSRERFETGGMAGERDGGDEEDEA